MSLNTQLTMEMAYQSRFLPDKFHFIMQARYVRAQLEDMVKEGQVLAHGVHQ